MSALSYTPWWVKLSAKLVLARLPLPYGFWRNLGLFRHGEMNVPERAINTFQAYYQKALEHASLPDGFESLELGPGDSILSGLVARAFGAKRAWLIDAGHFATTDVASCKETIALLKQRGLAAPDIAAAQTLSDVLAQAHVEYGTRGTDSLASIPDASIDFFWSQVVLEHIPKAELPRCLKELRRVSKPGGIGVHSVDFRDHLGGGLNNLRFPEWLWESRYFQNSGFYTNRIRPREMIRMFEEAGFSVTLLNEKRWPSNPIAKNRMARAFRHLPEEDFSVAEIEIIVRPA